MTVSIEYAVDESPTQAPALQRFQKHLYALTENISRAVVLSEETIHFVLLGLVARGHILLEDTPGVGKTLVAKTLAQSIEGKFSRIQCTPDLLPTDITGTSVFSMREDRFEFKPGPVFANVLIADEINRAGPRTQSALLEAMDEFKVSSDGQTYPLPRPFILVATQNLFESHGVFPLPDSQRDRFLMRMSLGMPSEWQEIEILSRTEHGLAEVSPVVTTEDVAAMQDEAERVNVAPVLKEYLVRLARVSREHPMVARGVSPRGTVLLQRAAQAWAAFEGRTYVVPEDVKKVAPLVLPHRIVGRAASDMTGVQVVQEILDTVPVPL